MLSKYGFAEALAEGNKLFEGSRSSGRFDTGEAMVVNIKQARTLGIYPMMSR